MSTVTLDNKTILVTGAAGFIGSNLVKRIYQEAPSATVIGIDNMNAYYDVALKEFRLNEQDLLALFERHGYDLVLLEGFGDSGWAKIEVVRSSVSPVGTAFQPMAIVGDVPGADFALDDPAALADWIENQMPSL